MAITDEITQVIRDRIQNFQGPSAESTTTSVGTVITVADGIARVYGLSGARYLELLEFPRTNTFGAVLRIRHALAFAIHQYFNDHGFYYVHTPIITGSDAEGAGQMFRVTTLPPEHPPHSYTAALPTSRVEPASAS